MMFDLTWDLSFGIWSLRYVMPHSPGVTNQDLAGGVTKIL
jgi:hypothetical protein